MRNPYKNYYFAVTVEDQKESGETGLYSYVLKVSACNNLLSVFNGIKGLKDVTIMETKKEAGETVTAWNNAYKSNGTYLFDCPAF